MALEAIVFPQDYCNYLCRDLYYSSLGGEGGEGGGGGGDQWCYNFGLEEEEEKEFLDNNWDSSSPSIIQQHVMKEQETNSSPDEYCNDQPYSTGDFTPEEKSPLITATTTRSKRRRTKNSKNKEQVENQRMTHIAVERNRRKQMNEYLAVLRSLMPTSYVQRGDQASIIGGAINFVKELEQLLQSLEAQKRITTHGSEGGDSTSPFANFFTFPQFSSCSTQSATPTNDSTAKNQSPIADIEVTMVESHASLKVLTPKRPKQLLKMVAGFQGLRLTILHLNVTTVEDMVLYSFNVKVEEDCHLTSVDEIATAVYQVLGRIQEEVSLRGLVITRKKSYGRSIMQPL